MLQIKNIYKEYKTGNLVQKALDGVSLNFRDNEFVAILGPSGSGKTTLLNIIGGLDRYDHGDLIINGISTKKYKDRDFDSYRNHTIGFVFQSYNLIPHQTVLSNVELALTISGISKQERKKRALEALKQVGLGDQGHKLPNQMSGGQMQRVAIARALVNNPDIVLADEPTGALDSETSIQVMDLLKEVAKDRLVIMVTHNPELAKTYATRIVELKDGKIISDSDEYVVDNNISVTHKTMPKASMSFLTALSLSFNNLKTKKARTFLTSFAGSIGIIGIALILSLSNGVNIYIKNTEEETLSEYPLQIQSSGFDMTSLLTSAREEVTKETDSDSVEVAQMITNMFSKIGSNDLKSLKEYLDNNKSIRQYTNAIEYTYNVSPQIYSSDTSNIRQVNPDNSFASLGIGSSSSSSSIMSSMMSTDVFYQMPSNKNLYEDQYDLKAGKWPTQYNECVLVLTNSGKISDFMLYTLGLRDYSELEKMIEQFSDGKKVETPNDIKSYSYDELLNIKFKLVNSYDYYQYDKKYDIYKDKSDDKTYIKNLIKNGEDLKIVGIVQPNDNSSANMLQTGIGYPASLTTHVIENAQNSEIVKKQLKNKKINVFTGKKFGEEENKSLDMNSLFSIDSNALKNAFKFDQSKLKMDTSSLDLSNIKIDFNSLNIDVNSILKDIDIPEIDQSTITELSNKLTNDYQQYAIKNNLTDPTKTQEYFMQYLSDTNTQSLIQKELTQVLVDSGMVDQFSSKLQKQMQEAMTKYSESISKQLQQQLSAVISKQMSSLSSSMANAISIDANAFNNAIKVNMTQEELSEVMASLMTTEQTSYDSNLSKLSYATFEEPSAINIYPKDFDSKQGVIDILDSYNDDMKKVDEDKVISYTDYVGTLMSSVTDIIDVISYVLIAFVSISLVVSSIMIGVITYISVLERKKEIGILRAMGASKFNISQVFNAETFIIGLLAGLIGIGLSLLLLIPGNMIIHTLANNNNINAVLPISGAIILIVLSVILTLLGGLIPSKKASKEDPVLALRSE